MFMTKIKSVLAVVLVAGLALGGIGAGAGLFTNPAAVAQTEPPKQPPAKEESSPPPVATKKDDKPPHIVEKPDKVAGVDTFRNLRFKVVGEPTEDSLLADSKLFMSRMPPSTHGDVRFRDFFDPRYLKKHGLTDHDIAFEFADHQGIHNIQVADDLRTVLCTVDPRGGKKERELILLRWAVYEGHMYISPDKAPDPKTGIFRPWILRTKR